MCAKMAHVHPVLLQQLTDDRFEAQARADELEAELERLRLSIREHWRTVQARQGDDLDPRYWAGRRDVLIRLLQVANIDPTTLEQG